MHSVIINILPQIISKASRVMWVKMSIGCFLVVSSMVDSSTSAQVRLCSLNTSTKLFRIWKWKAGVSNRRRAFQREPVVRNMQLPSQLKIKYKVAWETKIELEKTRYFDYGLRNEYWMAFVMSFWLLRIGSISSGDVRTMTGRCAPAQTR